MKKNANKTAAAACAAVFMIVMAAAASSGCSRETAPSSGGHSDMATPAESLPADPSETAARAAAEVPDIASLRLFKQVRCAYVQHKRVPLWYDATGVHRAGAIGTRVIGLVTRYPYEIVPVVGEVGGKTLIIVDNGVNKWRKLWVASTDLTDNPRYAYYVASDPMSGHYELTSSATELCPDKMVHNKELVPPFQLVPKGPTATE